MNMNMMFMNLITMNKFMNMKHQTRFLPCLVNSHTLQFMGFMELFMVVHEQYELFLVHSHDYEPLVHDIFIFIFTGSRVSPYSYSWVHKIFMNLFMVLQFYIHGFIGFSKKYSWIHDTKFMTSPTQIHEFIFFFMNIIHTTYEHIHGNGS